MVVIKSEKAEHIKVGDILAFKDPEGRKNVIITHRVIGIESADGKPSFKTKGDAVEDVDQFMVRAQDVVGKAVFIVPFIGYFFKYGKEPVAFLFLVILPASLIMADEIKKIAVYSNPLLKGKKEGKGKNRLFNYHTGRMLALFLIGLAIFGTISLPCLFESGYNSKTEIESGMFPSVVILKFKDDPVPRYTVLSSGKIEIPSSAMVSRAPYLMPVFWIELLADINPYLPGLATFLFPPSLLTLLLFPVWRRPVYKKRVKRRRLSRALWI